MVQGFGLQLLDGSIPVIASNKETLQKLIDQDKLLSFGTKIVELEVNTDEMTDKGREFQQKIREIWEERNLVQLRFDKQAGWYKMSPDERAEFVYNLLTIDKDECTPLDFGDSTRT